MRKMISMTVTTLTIQPRGSVSVACRTHPSDPGFIATIMMDMTVDEAIDLHIGQEVKVTVEIAEEEQVNG